MSVCALPTAIQNSLSWVVGELVADIKYLVGEPVDSISYPPYVYLNSRDQVGVLHREWSEVIRLYSLLATLLHTVLYLCILLGACLLIIDIGRFFVARRSNKNADKR